MSSLHYNTFCHLRDLEREAYKLRIDTMMHEENPFLSDFDGARIARERDYNSEPLLAALTAFAESRRSNIAVVKSLAPDDLNRPGRFENRPITLAGLLLMMKQHDQEHLRELADLCGQLQ